MNYWERWIGDWKKKTAHLSFEQKGAYGELLDYLYANDTPTLPLARDAIYRIAGAYTASERKSVDALLDPAARFFVLDDVGYHQTRVSAEIEKRQSYVAQQRDLANRRWHKDRPQKGNGTSAPNPTLALPDWIPADLFSSWWQAKPKRARTPHAHALAVKRLEELKAEGHEPTATLEHCIRSGYQGIFAPSAGNGKHATTPPLAGAHCAYCPDLAVNVTNNIPHCARLDHLDFALARRR